MTTSLLASIETQQARFLHAHLVPSSFGAIFAGMDKRHQESFRQVGAELRELTEQHPGLKHPIAQQHLQAWIEAQRDDASPEVLCGKLAKTIVEIVGLFQQHASLTDDQIEAILQASISLWEERSAVGK